MGREYTGSNSSAEKEVTNIVLPNGNVIEDAEYILLNTPTGGNQYYIWFKWNNGVQPSPALSGRTAIQVNYSYTDNNATVAANVAAAITSIAGADFTVEINNDILTLTNVAYGEVVDAEELTKEIVVDIQNQGKSANGSGATYVEGPMVEERVYLVLDGEDFYTESVRTNAEGMYQFKGLNRGKYTVYAFSKDINSSTGALNAVETEVEITKKKTVVEATQLFIVK